MSFLAAILALQNYRQMRQSGAWSRLERRKIIRPMSFSGEHTRAAVEATAELIFVEMKDAKKAELVAAIGRFAKRRLEETLTWKPDYRLRKRILDIALDR